MIYFVQNTKLDILFFSCQIDKFHTLRRREPFRPWVNGNADDWRNKKGKILLYMHEIEKLSAPHIFLSSVLGIHS